MRLGKIELETNVISAPMAGVTDKTFRILAREMGCELVCTEMVSDKALCYDNNRTKKLIDIEGEEAPVSVQLFGSDASYMAEAAKIVARSGATIIDINMGCPAPKIVKNGEGSALMRNLPLAQEIIRAVVEAVDLPVTVKMRLGWDQDEITVKELAKIAEQNGAVGITIHGRTRSQFYSGSADWDAIARVVDEVNIPVIGNGDVWEPGDAKRMIEHTGCAGVMIGRGAMGNPWIFKRTNHFLATGELLPDPSGDEKVAMARRHLDLIVIYKGEVMGVKEMRKHASWYIKGLPGATRMRELINRIETKDEMNRIMLEYEKTLLR
ncbi:nifR3 family TIM-barrel protein [Desulfitispora alkaliphila]|uniref:tRNA dihydrouridine synthase DusB n=1 Tax=Desulfitispora alkaliphila TaxID=622674 RepID=UPI003D20D902